VTALQEWLQQDIDSHNTKKYRGHDVSVVLHEAGEFFENIGAPFAR
jgi:hypothetical protein